MLRLLKDFYTINIDFIIDIPLIKDVYIEKTYNINLVLVDKLTKYIIYINNNYKRLNSKQPNKYNIKRIPIIIRYNIRFNYRLRLAIY